ncbi:MAG: class I SAM-dependent methyltransferase [Candidatus Thorarchaeota archaeon]
MTEKTNNLQVRAPEKWMSGWDNYYKKSLEKNEEELKDFAFISHPIQCLVAGIYGKSEGLKAIDLACGDGSSACFLAKIGCNVEAIDALESAIELTKKRAAVLGLKEKLHAEIKNIDGWDFTSESYDIIIATQCLQYLFERAIPRLQEIKEAIKPGGFIVYSGNILPHFETDPPMKFITKEELVEIFHGWTLYSIGTDERLLRPTDRRGYVWIVAQKAPKDE